MTNFSNLPGVIGTQGDTIFVDELFDIRKESDLLSTDYFASKSVSAAQVPYSNIYHELFGSVDKNSIFQRTTALDISNRILKAWADQKKSLRKRFPGGDIAAQIYLPDFIELETDGNLSVIDSILSTPQMVVKDYKDALGTAVKPIKLVDYKNKTVNVAEDLRAGVASARTFIAMMYPLLDAACLAAIDIRLTQMMSESKKTKKQPKDQDLYKFLPGIYGKSKLIQFMNEFVKTGLTAEDKAKIGAWDQVQILGKDLFVPHIMLGHVNTLNNVLEHPADGIPGASLNQEATGIESMIMASMSLPELDMARRQIDGIKTKKVMKQQTLSESEFTQRFRATLELYDVIQAVTGGSKSSKVNYFQENSEDMRILKSVWNRGGSSVA